MQVPQRWSRLDADRSHELVSSPLNGDKGGGSLAVPYAAEEKLTVLVDYWLAGHLGREWLRLRKSMRSDRGDLPALCESVARGAILPARTLSRVEDFAATIWLWTSGTPMVCFLVGAVAAKALSGGAIPFGIAAGVGSALLLLFAIAGAQIATALYRGGRVRLFLNKADGSAGALPLPPGSPGLPRRSDFWIALTLAVIVGGVILIAGLRAAPG
jgi:hypothetical protein